MMVGNETLYGISLNKNVREMYNQWQSLWHLAAVIEHKTNVLTYLRKDFSPGGILCMFHYSNESRRLFLYQARTLKGIGRDDNFVTGL